MTSSCSIMPVHVRQFVFGVSVDRLRFQLGIFRALLTRDVAVGAKAQLSASDTQVAVLIREPNVVNLLHRSAGGNGSDARSGP